MERLHGVVRRDRDSAKAPRRDARPDARRSAVPSDALRDELWLGRVPRRLQHHIVERVEQVQCQLRAPARLSVAQPCCYAGCPGRRRFVPRTHTNARVFARAVPRALRGLRMVLVERVLTLVRRWFASARSQCYETRSTRRQRVSLPQRRTVLQ